jgi:hypothetical protein
MGKKRIDKAASASSPPTAAKTRVGDSPGGSELYTQMMPADEYKPEKLGYVDFGVSGLKRFAGYIFEEFVNELTGKNAQKTYKEMYYNDPVASSLIFAIKMTARKSDWRVEPASEEENDLEAADFLEQCMNDMNRPWKEVINEILSMIAYGHAPMEVTYKKRDGEMDEPSKTSAFEDGAIGWQSIALRSQETILRWEFFENGDIKGLWQLAPPYYRLTYIPWEKFLLFRTDYSKNNPEGRSILRGAWRPWLFKKHLEEIEAIGAERGVSGIPIVWVPPNIAAPDITDTNAQTALTAYKELVKNIRRDSQEGIVFPMSYDDKGQKMYDLTLLTTQGTETGKIGEMIERKSREMLQVCLAEFIMLGSGKSGSFALSQTKVDLFLMAIETYLDLIAEVFNNIAVPRLFALNPQFKVEDYPKISHDGVKDMDLNNMSNYISKLITAGAMVPDMPLMQYLRSAAGLPDATEEDSAAQADLMSQKRDAEMAGLQQAQSLAEHPELAKPDIKVPGKGKDASPNQEQKPAGVKGKDKRYAEPDNPDVPNSD